MQAPDNAADYDLNSYAYPRIARSLLSTAHPKTGEINISVPVATGHPRSAIDKTVEEIVERGLAERTEDPLVLKLKSFGGK